MFSVLKDIVTDNIFDMMEKFLSALHNVTESGEVSVGSLFSNVATFTKRFLERYLKDLLHSRFVAINLAEDLLYSTEIIVTDALTLSSIKLRTPPCKN